jgi:hypothetical protein
VDTRDIDEGRAWKGGTGTATTDGTPTLFPDASRDGRETFRCSSLTGGRGLKGGTVTAGALLMACDKRKRDRYKINCTKQTSEFQHGQHNEDEFVSYFSNFLLFSYSHLIKSARKEGI